MDFRHLLPLVIFGGGFSLIGAVLYGAWLLGRYRGREESMPTELANVDRRLYEMERTIIQLTGSVDRLEAAHRLTAQMLTDQPAAARIPRRAVTPH